MASYTLVSTNIRITKSPQIGYMGRADTWAAPSVAAASVPEAEDIHPGLTAPAVAMRIRIIRNTRGPLRLSSTRKPGNRIFAQFRSCDDPQLYNCQRVIQTAIDQILHISKRRGVPDPRFLSPANFSYDWLETHSSCIKITSGICWTKEWTI